MADLHADPRISSKTTFAAAASMTLETLGAIDHFSSAIATSPSTRAFLRQSSAALEASNVTMFNAIRNGQGFSSGSIAENDAAFVRYEQGLVQGFLDGLNATDPGAYAKLVEESNATLNRRFGKSDQYNSVLDSARSSLGVEALDFANQDHRVAIGDALTSAIRSNEKVTCTGSRIKRSGC